MTDPADDIRRGRGRYPGYTRARLSQFAGRLRRAIHPARAAVEAVEVAGPTDRIGFAAAQTLDYRPAQIGAEFGPLWATWWVRLTARVPDDWRGRVELYWDSRSEALLRLGDRTIQGLNDGRHTAYLLDNAKGGETVTAQIEVACNRAFGDETRRSDPRPDPYRLADVHLRLFDAEAWDLYHDFEVLRQLEADREPAQTPRSFGGVAPKVVRPALDTTWAGKLLHELNRVCNILDPDDRTTWPAGHKILKHLLSIRNGGVVHELSAIGHAHIDTAWLWPIEETWRKCQRSFASVIALMDRYPEFKFACSQAYQYTVIEQMDPELFARIREKVKAGQWIPIGGSWVEPDCNLPSGEAMSRQFLYGQRFFEQAFGARSKVFWNPDVFGYAGQLPQLMREAGMTRFLTQKLSWNRFSTPPHHSFQWRGIDGTEVLTHFPPVDTYNAVASVEELRYHAANYKDADRSADALFLFGFGDGGGGPNAEMIESLRRTRDLLGVPRSTTRAPDDFFDRLESAAGDLATVEGELYFEYHRGTYTSQAEVKRLNRLAEGRLQTLEYLATASLLAARPAPDRAKVEDLWRVLLVNQFHDILPGSSIGEVYVRTLRELAALAGEAEALSQALLSGLCEPGADAKPCPVNPIGFPRAEVAASPDGGLHYVTAPPFAAGRVAELDETVRVVDARGEVRLENGRLTAVLAPDGTLRSLIHHATGAEALSGPGNRIILFDDRPTEYEAWDIDPFALETAREAAPADDASVVSDGPLRAEVRFERALGRHSRMVQTVRLDAGADRLEFHTEIDWRDRRTLVKAVFPINARARHATYETMFGAVERPTHANTDADLAQYEVPGHRWADLAEPGFGVALLSNARYGFSTFGEQMALSLVRGSRSPDPNADIGEHRFAYALYPHAGDWRTACVVAEAARFNRPLLWTGGEVAPILKQPLAGAAPAQVVIDTIKPAEDGDGWIVRIYESSGGRTRARLTFGVPVREIWMSNILEDRLEPLTLEAGGCSLDLRGFQIATVRVR
jgi:alpha-mannosidase